MLAIKDIEKQLDSAEKQRQLYVAMTRAQDRLILSGAYDSSSKSRSENWFSSLRNILQDYDQFLLKEYEAGKKGTAVKSAADLEQVLVTDELLQRIKPLPEYGLEWQRSLSATALQAYKVQGSAVSGCNPHAILQKTHRCPALLSLPRTLPSCPAVSFRYRLWKSRPHF